MNEKYGKWITSGGAFDNSYDAFLSASTLKSDVVFDYHNDVWHQFDRRKLGIVPLPILYKDRAQQLRDNYDYLILYYSGGADSHNILRTFIDNDIKLDEVCVKWPKQLIDGKFYHLNSTDSSARNYWSEWEYCVKPALEWLKINKPEIKITVKDYIDTLDVDQMFEKTAHHGFMAGILLNSLVSDSEGKVLSSGKTVGNIYGLDKPILALHDNKIFMFFSDTTFRSAVRSDINPAGAECFYWTPDMPLLAYEQAYQTALYYRATPRNRKYLVLPRAERDASTNNPDSQILMQHVLCKDVIYNNWDHRFQADKPSIDRKDKFYWFFEQSELATHKDAFSFNVESRRSLIDPRFIKNGTLLIVWTEWFYVTDL